MLTPRILLAALTALALTSAQQCITPSPPTPDAPTLLASSESTTVIVTDPGSDASTHRLAQSFATDIRAVVPGATHLFEEPGALDRVVELALEALRRNLAG